LQKSYTVLYKLFYAVIVSCDRSRKLYVQSSAAKLLTNYGTTIGLLWAGDWAAEVVQTRLKIWNRRTQRRICQPTTRHGHVPATAATKAFSWQSRLLDAHEKRTDLDGNLFIFYLLYTDV